MKSKNTKYIERVIMSQKKITFFANVWVEAWERKDENILINKAIIAAICEFQRIFPAKKAI